MSTAVNSASSSEKYAAASAATVHLREERERLLVEVRDDGRGFDVTAVVRGAGLTNMEDRLEALGGTLQIESTPSVGTALRATVPVSHAVPVAVSVSEALIGIQEAPRGV
jgi:signal transduction histidine kinase